MENPFLARDRQMVGDCYTTTEVMDTLTVLCDEYGSRFGGTDGEKLAADYIKQKLESYGLSHVHLEPFEYMGWRRGQVSLEITSPIVKKIPCITLPHSPATDLVAEVIDLGDGEPEIYEQRAAEIAGKIVMVNSKTKPKGTDRWVHRNEKYGRALLVGAVGFIFVNHYPGYGPATGGIGNNAEAPIPGISVSYEDGAFLQRLIKRQGKVRLHVTSNDVCQPMTSWNVVGELVGSAPDPQIVMLGCHYDGHDISQGAGDPASGAVAVMEAARLLAAYGGQLAHTVRVALWGVEEIGLIGSSEYVQAHLAEMDKIRFYFNMDGAGKIDQKDVVLNEWPELASLFAGWSEEMALPFAVGQSVSAHSDHFPFLMEGVPTASMQTAEREMTGRGYGHTAYDTLDKVDLRGLREASVMAARLAMRVASATEWPVARRSHEAVADLFDKPAYKEERAINARIDAYKETLKK